MAKSTKKTCQGPHQSTYDWKHLWSLCSRHVRTWTGIRKHSAQQCPVPIAKDLTVPWYLHSLSVTVEAFLSRTKDKWKGMTYNTTRLRPVSLWSLASVHRFTRGWRWRLAALLLTSVHLRSYSRIFEQKRDYSQSTIQPWAQSPVIRYRLSADTSLFARTNITVRQLRCHDFHKR